MCFFVFFFTTGVAKLGQTHKTENDTQTWVRFSDELKFCYDELLQEIYEEILQWAYEGDKMEMPRDIMRKCIMKRKMKALSTTTTSGKS